MNDAIDTADWHWRTFYLSRDGEVSGPFTAAQVRSLWQRGEMTLADYLCPAGSEQWVPTEAARDFLDELPPLDRQVAPVRVIVERPPMDPGLKKLLYFLFAFFLGGLGIHNVLAGEWGEFCAKWVLLIIATVMWQVGVVVLPLCIAVTVGGWILWEVWRGPREV